MSRQRSTQTASSRRIFRICDLSRFRHARRRPAQGVRFSLILVSLFAVALSGSCDITPIALAAEKISADELEFFEARIRPVLAEQCYGCHNSIDTAEGGLALDSREAVLNGGENGSVVTPNEPAASRLLATIRHDIEGLEMPDGGAKLDDAVIADFEKWIRIGAPDPRDKPPTEEELSAATSWENVLESRKKWWSFRPIANPSPPSGTGVDHPIDRFIAAKRQEMGLKPTTSADAATLVRRIYFNLTGLPPTPEEAAKWVAAINTGDRNEQVAALVDERLASPHFGERWARHWMDWVRYAESHGSEGDPGIENAWLYRDYLIRALNDDIPYDQLLREHVAGDLLDSPRINEGRGINESLIGTAHWRMVFHGFAPTDALDERVRFTDDQIDTFSKAFLGLTVSCARCHDHKFDAISQADYYALFGIMQSCRPGRSVIEVAETLSRNETELADVKSAIRAAAQKHWLDGLSERVKAAAKSVPEKRNLSDPLDIVYETQRRTEAGTPFKDALEAVLADLSARIDEANSRDDNVVQKRWSFDDRDDVAAWTKTGSGVAESQPKSGAFAIADVGDAVIEGIYPAGVYSHLVSSKNAARITSPDFDVVGPTELWLRVFGANNAAARYVVQDYPRKGTVYPVPALNAEWQWQRHDMSYWSGDRLHVELATAKDAPLLTSNNPRSWFGITEAVVAEKGKFKPPQSVQHFQPLVDAINLARPGSLDDLVDAVSNTISQAVKSWSEVSSDAEADLLSAFLGTPVLPNSQTKLSSAAPLVAKYRELEQQRPLPTRVPALEEAGGSDNPLYVRGNHKKPDAQIPRRFLEAIDSTPYETSLSGRRELAEDLVAESNPFTRRVIVNRVWHHLFGNGLVSTPDNFGQLGTKPTHPLLLDYLATQFAEEGWSLKRLIRSIVLTDTWQLASTASPDAIERDPDNRYLARANIRRLEAEAIRDSLLAVSNQLDRKLYGPPVDSAQPRRGVYVRVIRNRLDPFLRTFDFPEPSKATGRRDVTNVPAQALAMMNDRTILKYAAGLANRSNDSNAPSDATRIKKLVDVALSRTPSDDELSRLQAFLDDTRSRHRNNELERQNLKQQLDTLTNQVAGLESPVRKRLEKNSDKRNTAIQSLVASPVAQWNFSESLDDVVGSLDISLQQSAERTPAGLRTNGQGYAISKPLSKSIRERTLEAWVTLDDVQQRGGGVMTIQSRNGVTFDSIVFAEIAPGQWLSGSNNHRRSQRIDGPSESAANVPIHLAITYAADGTITCYRNGKPYGSAYKTSPAVEFSAKESNILFGLRHLPPGGNRYLHGTISRAGLYDKALSADEVLASYESAGQTVTSREVVAAMSEEQRTQHAALTLRRNAIAKQLERLPNPPGPDSEWTELARAVLLFKEFLYIR